MIGLVRASSVGPFARLRARAAGRPVVACGLGAGGGVDVLVGDTALAPDGKTLAVATIGRYPMDRQGKSFFDTAADRAIRLWDLNTGREVDE